MEARWICVLNVSRYCSRQNVAIHSTFQRLAMNASFFPKEYNWWNFFNSLVYISIECRFVLVGDGQFSRADSPYKPCTHSQLLQLANRVLASNFGPIKQALRHNNYHYWSFYLLCGSISPALTTWRAPALRQPLLLHPHPIRHSWSRSLYRRLQEKSFLITCFRISRHFLPCLANRSQSSLSVCRWVGRITCYSPVDRSVS